jgi:hypothetical protein
MAEMAYQVDYYIHVDTKEAALDLITHLPFNGHIIDTKEVADYASPAIEQSINQVVQVTKMEDINEHIQEVRELVKNHSPSSCTPTASRSMTSRCSLFPKLNACAS